MVLEWKNFVFLSPSFSHTSLDFCLHMSSSLASNSLDNNNKELDSVQVLNSQKKQVQEGYQNKSWRTVRMFLFFFYFNMVLNLDSLNLEQNDVHRTLLFLEVGKWNSFWVVLTYKIQVVFEIYPTYKSLN